MTEARLFEESGLAGDIARLVEPSIEALGLVLVRVNLSGRDGGTLQIMIDRPDGVVTIEDCTLATEQLSPLMDAHDPISGRYRLEISSPGIDRPLVRASDFERWSGHEAKIELKDLLAGRKRFRGLLDGIESDEVRLVTEVEGFDEPQVIGLPLEAIAHAKLVMTDDLIREALRKSKQHEAPV